MSANAPSNEAKVVKSAVIDDNSVRQSHGNQLIVQIHISALVWLSCLIGPNGYRSLADRRNWRKKEKSYGAHTHTTWDRWLNGNIKTKFIERGLFAASSSGCHWKPISENQMERYSNADSFAEQKMREKKCPWRLACLRSFRWVCNENGTKKKLLNESAAVAEEPRIVCARARDTKSHARIQTEIIKINIKLNEIISTYFCTSDLNFSYNAKRLLLIRRRPKANRKTKLNINKPTNEGNQPIAWQHSEINAHTHTHTTNTHTKYYKRN